LECVADRASSAVFAKAAKKNTEAARVRDARVVVWSQRLQSAFQSVYRVVIYETSYFRKVENA
jgi:hypothetical protein